MSSSRAVQHGDILIELSNQIYEGGFKIWECTIDLLRFLNARPELVQGASVLDLGCGAGLAGLCAVLNGANIVHFHDYVSVRLPHAATLLTRYLEYIIDICIKVLIIV